MLTVGMTATGPAMILQPVSPMVYLDHWALRKFSSQPRLASRFVSALRAAGGTLVVSWLNLAEYATVSDSEQRRQAEVFVEDALPHVFFLQVDAFDVERRELGGESVPHADVPVAETLLAPRDSAKPITASGLFSRLHDAGLARQKALMADKILAPMVERQRRGLKFAGSQPTSRAVRVFRALVDALIEDPGRRITRNDAVDLLHATVPAALCDIVVLDGAWQDRVGRAQRRLNKEKPPVQLAVAFSGRRDGTDRFLTHLAVSASGH